MSVFNNAGLPIVNSYYVNGKETDTILANTRTTVYLNLHCPDQTLSCLKGIFMLSPFTFNTRRSDIVSFEMMNNYDIMFHWSLPQPPLTWRLVELDEPVCCKSTQSYISTYLVGCLLVIIYVTLYDMFTWRLSFWNLLCLYEEIFLL